jgi:hypothetical protein
MKEYYYEIPQEATDMGGFSDTPEEDHGILFQGYTNYWSQIAVATTFLYGGT